jgi:putative flippase GtrA
VDAYQREGETEAQRLDRNWDELLQEFRVSQTGVQILTGFLLTLPIQPAFHGISTFERAAYVAAISASILATCLLITPVAMHRWLFRQRRKETLVHIAHHLAISGLVVLAGAVVSVMAFTFSLVFTEAVGVVVAVCGVAVFLGAWVVFPLSLRRRFAGKDRSTSP